MKIHRELDFFLLMWIGVGGGGDGGWEVEASTLKSAI
jgi:hypothetical protein